MEDTTTFDLAMHVRVTMVGLKCPHCRFLGGLTRRYGDVMTDAGPRPAYVDTCSWCNTITLDATGATQDELRAAYSTAQTNPQG